MGGRSGNEDMQTDTPEKKRNHASFIIILMKNLRAPEIRSVMHTLWRWDSRLGMLSVTVSFSQKFQSSRVTLQFCCAKKPSQMPFLVFRSRGDLLGSAPQFNLQNLRDDPFFPGNTWFTWSKINIKWCLFPGNTVILDRKLTKKCLLGRWHGFPSESWSLLRGYSLIFGGGVLSVIYEPWMQLVKEFHLQNVPFFYRRPRVQKWASQIVPL